MSLFRRSDYLLFKAEMRRFLTHRRSLFGFPLTFIGVYFVVQRDIDIPFLPVVMVLLCILEAQFNNILYRSPRELEALSLLPLSWKRVVFIKNLSTIVLVIILFPTLSAFIIYFSPRFPSAREIQNACVWLSTLVFPLLHVGNLRSLRSPRRDPGWTFRDLAEAAWMPVFAGVFSLPYLILQNGLESTEMAVLYALAGGLFWYRISLRFTARELQQDMMALWENLSTSSTSSA